MSKRVALFGLLLIAALGFGSAVAALAWQPEAYSRYAAAGPLACDQGIGMWVWGISSDGTGHGPLSGGEQKKDPRWEAECAQHLRSIQGLTVAGVVIGLAGLGGGIAVARAERRGIPSRVRP